MTVVIAAPLIFLDFRSALSDKVSHDVAWMGSPADYWSGLLLSLVLPPVDNLARTVLWFCFRPSRHSAGCSLLHSSSTTAPSSPKVKVIRPGMDSLAPTM